MYLWCRLPHDLCAIDVARKAHKKGVVLAPGNVFSLTGSSKHFLLFNVSQCASEKIFDVLEEIIVADQVQVDH